MINLKSTVIARTLDDSKTDFKIKTLKGGKDEEGNSVGPDYMLK